MIGNWEPGARARCPDTDNVRASLIASATVVPAVEEWVHVAGLAAMAWLVLPHSGPHLIERLLEGWLVGFSAMMWAAAVVMLLHLSVPHWTGMEMRPANWRSAGAGVWFAPAILLPLSPASIAAALVTSATRSLCAQAEPPNWSAPASRAVLDTGGLWWN